MATATAKKSERFPDEAYLADALKGGRATLHERFSMDRIGEPNTKYQAREAHVDLEHVRLLNSILENQGRLAPVVIFGDERTHILADGFHRWETHRRAGRFTIPAYVIQADDLEHEALSYAAMCNRRLSLPRKMGDIRKAVTMLLGDESWFARSPSEIAAHVGVSPGTVQRVRIAFCDERGIDPPVSGRMKPKPQVPEVYYNEDRGVFTGWVDGKLKSLGSRKPGFGVPEAREKLAALRPEMPSISEFPAPKYATSSVFIKAAAARGVRVETCGNAPTSGMGQALKSGAIVACLVDRVGHQNIAELVGVLTLNSFDIGGASRKVIACNSVGSCAAIDIAATCGFEFMTPDELIASLERGN